MLTITYNHETMLLWKILYEDGDVEILRLEKERWELVDKGRKSTKVSGFSLLRSSFL